MVHYFSVSEGTIQLTIAYNFLGFCIGGLFFGPLSECYGRRRIMIIGNTLLLIGAVLTELPEVNSTQELSIPSNEPVKIDTPDQPKSPAVPSEPQETLVNAHEEKGKPNNTASNEEVQPEVSNEEVTIESGEFFDEEDDGVTQPKSLTADQVAEQPASGSEVASPSETKNGSNNGAVVLYQMLHDQGILHPSPELYDYLLRASLVKEMLFCKVAPNSSLVQTREEQVASNNRSC
ncbi:uncharacterized protein TNIN_37031 [Trichonephila inaurata madagascariensis]|uniref:Uncharacterized protein n=1 Tax=Trichonephila inaurata madagascariensis TaxID=2747483 RepID=A0A8X6Y362_9ARAC|nr:uncharacterized protein TNIN_37031 [Trichonephila inaurata madagascariensis]